MSQESFHVELFPMLGMTHYRVRVSSLPLTSPEQTTGEFHVATSKYKQESKAKQFFYFIFCFIVLIGVFS